MGLRETLRRLRAESRDLYGVLRLPDGTEVRYGQGELLDALLATIDGREHRLLPYLREMDAGDGQGLPGLIGAIERGGDGA